MGSMISGAGNIYSGIAGGIDEQQAAQTEWNANDALARYAERAALMKGQRDAGDVRAKGSQVGDSQYVAYANSGVDPAVGTAATVQADTAAQSELDAQTAKNNAARAAWGFKVQREQAKQQYNAQVKGSQNRAIGSVVTGAGQIAGGAGSLGGS